MDVIQKFLLEEIDIRGSLICLGASLTESLEPHQYPEKIKRILSEAIASAVMVGATLKNPGKLALHAKGDGAVEMIVAEATNHCTYRGIAQFRTDEIGEKSFSDLLGQAQLAMTVSPDRGQRYQGIVPLDGETLADCLAYYFEQSEQLPTYFRFAHEEKTGHIYGIFLQKLPEQRSNIDDDSWNRIMHLVNTLNNEEIINTPSKVLLERIFHEEDLRLFDSEPALFKCSCSRERSLNSLKILGKDESLQLLEEQALIEIDCEFCKTHYQFNRSDVLALFGLSQPH